MGNDKKDNPIYNVHDIESSSKNLFESFRHAKKILAKVAIEFFDNGEDSNDLEKFESFMKGVLKPKFVTNIEEVGYYPDLANGCYSISVLVDPDDCDNERFKKWTKVLKEVQPSTGDFFLRSLMRIYQDFYNDNERKLLSQEVNNEILKEDEKSQQGE